ncbi:proteophosphoglycan ppg4 [Pyrenophora seminiperda CCB06]|uniref:Proteophosphoglycan ppg4 n=1 Tax=Pyrenophora seminiperda CCB06 TaxID=1302712 RepID=A0A3M7MHK6_9PLEO|nr:proteophosphoglycan ppg4 [Pyrenophora seminiperda CCB06]
MGNQPSTANHHHRLSKPKTNTNSAVVAPKTDSPEPISIHADLSAESRQQIRDTLLSPSTTESPFTAWAHNDDTVGDSTQTRGRPLSLVSRSNSKANSRTHSRSNSLSCFGSRHGSAVKLGGLADSQTSLASISHVNIAEAIRLLQEVKKNGTPDDLAALQGILEAPDESATSAADSLPDRNSPQLGRSTSSLTRRQSLLQTPGVGTRNSPVEGRRRTWNSWKAPKLEADEEAKWRSKPKPTSQLPSQTIAYLTKEASEKPMPRAETPTDMNYSQLGSLKLGSLVVTNGAPSPSFSARDSRPRQAETDEYFSAAEENSSPLMMKSARRRGPAKSMSAALPQSSPLYQMDTPDVPLPYDIRTVTNTAIIKPSSLPKLVELAASNEPSQRSLRVMNMSIPSASQLAHSYQADIPTSPFEPSVKESPTFADEDLVLYDASFQTAPIFQDAFFAEPEPQSEAKVSMPSSQKSKKRSDQRPSPRTMDSGYSSGGSMRMADQNQPCCRCSGTLQESEMTSQKGMPKSILRNKSTNSSNSPSSSSAEEGDLKVNRRPSSLQIPIHSSSSSARSSASESLLSPQTPRSITSGSSFESNSSKPQKKHQHRSRPSQTQNVVVQSCQPIPEGTIPEVPIQVRAKFERRMSQFPEVECLTHTYPTKDHVSVKERNDTTTFPVLDTVKPLAELEPERSTTAPMHSRRKSLSFLRRKPSTSKHELEKEAEMIVPHVIDFGTSAMSLGTSPYDAAMSRLSKPSVSSPTHPYQLGSLPRTKSMVNMDSKAATEYARLHSRDLAFTDQNMPRQRRKSCHNIKMEAGEATAVRRRPQGSDIPPVPAIDTTRFSVSPVAKPLLGSSRSEQRASQIASNYESRPQMLAVPPQGGHRRRKSTGEVLHSKKAIANGSVPPKPQALEDIASWGRFSGGLQYNYEGRGAGVGGSAGTRQLHSYASVKSLHYKHQYGVDLSDVPIMLQRA